MVNENGQGGTLLDWLQLARTIGISCRTDRESFKASISQLWLNVKIRAYAAVCGTRLPSRFDRPALTPRLSTVIDDIVSNRSLTSDKTFLKRSLLCKLARSFSSSPVFHWPAPPWLVSRPRCKHLFTRPPGLPRVLRRTMKGLGETFTLIEFLNSFHRRRAKSLHLAMACATN